LETLIDKDIFYRYLELLDDPDNYKISMSADYEEFSIIPKNDPSWLIAFDLDDLRRNVK